MTQNRVPEGVPTGGQFATSAKARSAVTLDDVAEVNREAAASSGPLDSLIGSAMPQPDFTTPGNGTYAHPGNGEKGRLAAALAQDDASAFPGTGSSYAGLNTRFGMYFKRGLSELRATAAARGARALDTSPERATEADRLRCAESMLGRSINAASDKIGDADDRAYFSGMEYAYAEGAASLLQPHDQDKRNKINMTLQMANTHNLRNRDVERAEFMAGISDLASPGGISEQLADQRMREMLGAAVRCRQGAGEKSGSAMSSHQRSQLGMSNGFAEVAATWATPEHFNNQHTGVAQNITQALADGLTDVDELAQVARGQMIRDDRGEWYGPNEYFYGED